MKLLYLFTIYIVLFCFSPSSSSSSYLVSAASRRNVRWGRFGHSATAAIAQTLLSSNSTAQLLYFLPEVNGQMDLIASWADTLYSNSNFSWSFPLHFADSPDWACNYDPSKDCSSPEYGNNICVDSAIQNYTLRASDLSLSFEQRSEAIKFLVHFMGDIHQPLHAGFKSNLGGNSLTGNFYGNSSNLHAIWDYYIISNRINRDYQANFTIYVQSLITKLNSLDDKTVQSWLTCSIPNLYGACTFDWLQESSGYACGSAYVNVDGYTPIRLNYQLGEEYYLLNLPIIEQRLLQGAVRLANLLNQIFS